MGNDIQSPVFLGDLLLETTGAFFERGDPGRRGHNSHIAFGIGICPLDGIGENIGSEAARLNVVSLHKRGESRGIRFGFNADDLDLLGSLIDRLAKLGKLRGRDDDRRRDLATACARMPIWPLISVSESAPSLITLTPKSRPAWRAPANTVCQ
jgi:hypothetical protein